MQIIKLDYDYGKDCDILILLLQWLWLPLCIYVYLWLRPQKATYQSWDRKNLHWTWCHWDWSIMVILNEISHQCRVVLLKKKIYGWICVEKPTRVGTVNICTDSATAQTEWSWSSAIKSCMSCGYIWSRKLYDIKSQSIASALFIHIRPPWLQTHRPTP